MPSYGFKLRMSLLREQIARNLGAAVQKALNNKMILEYSCTILVGTLIMKSVGSDRKNSFLFHSARMADCISRC